MSRLATVWLVIAGVVAAAAQTPPLRPSFQLLEASIDDVREAIKGGRVSCRQLVQLYLKRIEAYDKAGPALNAVQAVNGRALQEADRLDAAFKAGGAVGLLHCVPVLLKDQVETSDMPTTYGSAVFKDFVSKRDATIVTRLKRAGAIIVAKATMGEYASGYFGSASGVIRNAYDSRRSASGSSGGTGTGIAANFATVGIGEDTGGSVRGPAAVNNLVGIRPTLPLVSRHGMMPARPSTDTIGPITRTVKDAALVLDVIAGYDANDPVTSYAVGQIPATYASFLTSNGLRGARLGVIRDPMDGRTDRTSDDYRKVRAVIDKAIADLKAAGADVVDPIAIPGLIDRVTKGYDNNQFETEAATNAYLAQLDNSPVKTLREILLSGKVVPSRARALMSSIGRTTDDAGYLQVLNVKEDTRQVVLKLMADNRLDALVYATFDHQPPVIAPDVMTKAVVDDVAGYGNNRRLSPMLGFPAITVPAGFTTDGLPVGLEFMGRAFAEPVLLRLAFGYEQATHHRKPPPTTPAIREGTAGLAADLRRGMQLVYASGDREQAPWVVDAVDHTLRLKGDADCATLAIRRQPGQTRADESRLCVDRGTLHSWDSARNEWTPQRPVGPHMQLTLPRANGDTVRYETAALGEETIGSLRVEVVATTVTTIDSSGGVKRRLRERYATSLATATGGVFEVPDASASTGWRTEQTFELRAIR